MSSDQRHPVLFHTEADLEFALQTSPSARGFPKSRFCSGDKRGAAGSRPAPFACLAPAERPRAGRGRAAPAGLLGGGGASSTPGPRPPSARRDQKRLAPAKLCFLRRPSPARLCCKDNRLPVSALLAPAVYNKETAFPFGGGKLTWIMLLPFYC